MLRFIVYAVPLLVLLLALFGFTVELLEFEPREGAVIKLALFDQPRVPGQLILGTWLVEASGLIALFLLTQGRFGTWWLDGLVAGWVGWIFRGPLLVITIVVAARQPQDPWWTLAFGWWVLYSVCGLSLAILARRSGLEPWQVNEPAAVLVAEAGESLAVVEADSKEAEVASDEVEARAEEEAEFVTGEAEAQVDEEAAIEPQPIEPQSVEPQPIEPQSVEPQPIESSAPEAPKEPTESVEATDSGESEAAAAAEESSTGEDPVTSAPVEEHIPEEHVKEAG